MIDSAALLTDLKKQLKLLQVDLRERAEDPDDSWGQRLREQHGTALERGRTGHAWVTWRDGEVDQAAVAWLVATTFIRFCEDNDLLVGARDADGRVIPVPWIAGPGVLLERALEHETAFFTQRPSANRRDWLQESFKALAAQPAGRALVDPQHSLVWSAEISAEAADDLVAFWRAADTEGYLVHEFTDPDLDTRFLGDLYQDLSEYAKKTYALLQTPVFVEEFILDQTLTPAVEEFGVSGLKVIDPTCGSGHFLLGSFARLNQVWADQAPGLDVRERVQRAMSAIHGVDLNPFAVAIARFRLTVAGLQAAGLKSLVEAPDFAYRLAVGDSLLGGHQAQLEFALGLEDDEESFEYDAEDLSDYHGILKNGQYHVVVGNPPYITVGNDPVLNALYRNAYPMAFRKYQLTVPFMELFFRLAIKGADGAPAGYVGKITSNAFMTREFGKKMVEQLLAGHVLDNPVDLTNIIDSSGAWFPGHNFDGTPTVIMVGRRRRPQSNTIRTVLGIRGDAGRLQDPARGPVWRELSENFDTPGYDGTYVSVADLPRTYFAQHPWSLTGGGADRLLSSVTESADRRLADVVETIGFSVITGDDEFLVSHPHNARRLRADALPYVVGDQVRDWTASSAEVSLVPTLLDGTPVEPSEGLLRWLWRGRTVLAQRQYFGQTPAERGMRWFDYAISFPERNTAPQKIVFAFVATHNHFVVDAPGRVFKQSAPVITLPSNLSTDHKFGIVGLLNSSLACFWIKQVCYPKDKNAEPWATRFEITGTKMLEFPLKGQGPYERAAKVDVLRRELGLTDPAAVLANRDDTKELSELMSVAQAQWQRVRERMIFEQEELDWEAYRLYGLVEEDLTYHGDWPADERRLSLGERAFEIVLARQVAAGTEETAWFERHGSNPITEPPSQLPTDYRTLVERRLQVIESNKAIRLLERPEFKRRWATRGWDALLKDALIGAILDRLEQRELWFDSNGQPLTRSVGDLANAVRHDGYLIQCAQLLVGNDDISLAEVLGDVLKEEPVPYLAALRYKPSGLENFRAWQEVWDLQRQQDEGEKVTIPLPPKYGQADFLKTGYWRARGKLDVPKERFIAYPGVIRAGDNTPVIGWAGWDHAEQAQALARELGTQQGLGAERQHLLPLVAGLVELEPWLDQWHGEIDPRYGQSPANLIHQTVESYAGQLGVTRDDLNAWRPPAPTRGRRRATA